ncbi:MAG: DUF3944 domain-containing protein [Duncaniella sp.]|nr:DUF3944 domain-containing protein [Duncaniella sp.]
MEELNFLYKAANDDLRLLCDIIVKDKDGKYRLTEELSATEIYKKCYPNHMRDLVPQMVTEFRKFGGNTLVNFFRGNGPTYNKILRDVADRCKVNYNKHSSNEQIEQYLLQKLFADALDKATDEELKAMMEEMGLPTQNFGRQAAVAALLVAWKSGGFSSYILLVSVANGVVRFLAGRGLPLAANAALTRTASILAGPVGWALTALWTAVDIAGPAYRVTVPAVIQIAYIRQKVNTPNIETLLLLK